MFVTEIYIYGLNPSLPLKNVSKKHLVNKFKNVFLQTRCIYKSYMSYFNNSSLKALTPM